MALDRIRMKISTISKDNDFVFAQWQDGTMPMRGHIPVELVMGDEVSDEAMSLAIPYGIDWTFYLEGAGCHISERVAMCLRKANVWTLQDVIRNPAAVDGALKQAYSLYFQVIMKLAKDSGGI